MNPQSKEYKELQLKLMKEYAESKGGECLAIEYISSHTRYLWKDADGSTWKACWYNYKNRGGWSKKAGYEKNAKSLIKYTIQDIQEKFASPKGGKILSTDYKNTKSKLLWEDSKGREFKMSLEHVIAGQWSPHDKKDKLSELKKRFTIEELVEFCKAKHNVELLDTEYKGTTAQYTFKDSEGVIFKKTLSHVLKTDTLRYKVKSSPEEHLSDFLSKLGIDFIQNDRKILGGKELDFFIPSLNLAIEYHGLHWHTYDKVGNLHFEKYKECNKLGIRLIQVFEHEWLSRRNQVISFLTSALLQNTIKVNARECSIGILDNSMARDILNDNHIQGAGKFNKCYALFHNSQPVMLITIGKHHRTNTNGVLTRCVAVGNVTVRGGLSRLCKYAATIEGNLTTWVDLRWSTGKSWVSCGWKFEQQLPPDYFYYQGNTKKVISKQSRKKSVVGTPAEMTEAEHAKLDGLKTVKDAGKIRLVYKL